MVLATVLTYSRTLSIVFPANIQKHTNYLERNSTFNDTKVPSQLALRRSYALLHYEAPSQTLELEEASENILSNFIFLYE